MFDKDIQHYIEEDGELTLEASEMLYGEHPPRLWETEPVWVPEPRWGVSARARVIIGLMVSIFLIFSLTTLFSGDESPASKDVSGTTHVTEVAQVQNTLSTVTPVFPSMFSCSLPVADREWIIFSAGTGYHSDLYLITPEIAVSTCRIPLNASNPHAPMWSPDGTWIAYKSLTDDGTLGIYVMNMQNQLTRQVIWDTTHPYITSMAWGPSGDRLIVQADAGRECSDLFISTIHGATQQLTSGESCDITPDWSPDGSMIVFARSKTREEDLEIVTFNLINGQLRQLTENRASDYGPVWSPDGTKIMFASENGIYVMNADGTNRQRVIEYGQWPTWSPDGARIAFVSSHGNVKGNETALFIANADGSEITRLTNYINANRPDWGP